ncbi:hypothetical protein C0989_010557, partial [Termitomyces sp. Mn162]
FSWLRSTNPHVNWPSLTLRLDRDNPTDSRLVPFDVSLPSKNSETMIDQPRTPPQLRSRSAWSFDIYVQLGGSLKVLPALVDSGASSVFVSNQLNLRRNDLNKPLELQLFVGSPAMTRITQMTQDPLTPDDNPNRERSTTLSQSPSDKLQWLPHNIPRNRYKGLRYPNQRRPKPPTDPNVTPDSTVTPTVPNPVNPGDLDIKIIGAVPFVCLLQEGTPTFQLQVTPALPKEYLRAGTTVPESKTEEQILSE